MQINNAASARLRRKQLQGELVAIADEMDTLVEDIDNKGLTPELDARLESLTTRAEPLTAELKALNEKFFTGTRLTAPTAVHKRGATRTQKGFSMSDGNNDFCKLHGRDFSNLDDGGFSSFAEFLSVLGSGLHDSRIVEMKAAAAGSLSSSGGAMVPERFIAESLHPAGEDEQILPLARKFSMTEGTLRVSTLDNLVGTNGQQFGGFTAEWVAEGGQFTEQTPVTSSIQLTRKKLGLFTMASQELVSDSDYERELIPALGQAMREFRDDAFFNGNGAGKPMGILYNPAIIEVAKESGQPADTIVIQNLDKMYSRMHPRVIRSAVWFVNPTTIPQLMSLVRSTGTSGAVVPVLNESNGSFSLYGLPCRLTSKLPVLGDSGDILLCAPSQYAIGFGPEVAIERSEHYKFQTGQIAWRAVWRGDGQGCWRAPYTPKNGDTLSWSVKLAARA